MADSPRRRSRSRSRSRPRSPSRSRSRSGSRGREDATNPGNTLYVTGLSTRVTDRDLEDHFSREGKVLSCRLVVEPRTRISRGFAFVTMDSLEDAERCITHLNQSVLEGRYITVEKSRRKRPRTPTPGNYLGMKSSRESSYRGGDRGRYRGGYGRDDYGYRRSPRHSPYRGGHDYSPRRSPYGGRSRRERSRSPPYSSYSPDRGYGRRPNAYAR
ncbi:serine/arginine-rich splicing factor SR45a-like [Telopea speciosissima]|uniref:serine/arginine-rich splicing factor SR45a-like n=1 Tax=Telopea speciosissima TaxID=54955 RepID=UPI001CC37943|nr:serine/arginine-rich splicing factor SR45a-like [Telopea speciosissima]